MSIETEQFVRNTAIGGAYEVEAGRVALSRTQSDAIRRIAHRMIADHAEISSRLEAVLRSNATDRLAIPGQDLDARHQAMLEKLQTVDDIDFDHAYLEQQHNAHEETLSLMQSYGDQGDDEALRSFAVATARMVEDHLVAIRNCRSTR